MNLSRSPDTSLYELAADFNQTPQPLKISPTTFKSTVGLVFDLLIERKIPATVWLKLPKGEVWQAEVQRFCQLATAPYSLYCLQTQQDLEKSKGSKRSAAKSEAPWDLSEMSLEATDTELDQVLGQSREPIALDEIMQGSQIHSLPLAAQSQLKREYFLLVAAPEFYGLMLVHRPRSGLSKSEGRSAKAAKLPLATPAVTAESLEQKHPLLGLCTFEADTLRQVLDGINRAICFGQPETQSSDVVAKLLITWEQLVETGTVTTLNPVLLGDLLVKQIQRQEDIWRSGATHRRQSESVSTLRLENDELLNTVHQKDEFIKIMGQELRTPLTTMKTALSLLNSPSIKPPQRQRYMDMLSQECDRQSSLITSVLDLVQIESTVDQVPMEALRLSEIVPGVVSTYQPLAQEKGIMLGYTIPEDLLPVSCISPWLKQIVINLLHNSIKFTSSAGQVWVRAKQQGDYVQIEFRDTGVGIAQSDLPKIFDRFYRIRIASGEDSSGSGLGLSIVQQLLLRCGGSIAVKSKVNEGSIFTVLLPVFNRS
ncbi:MAG: histidine kinase [Drouetiella hepatica Uher 2000/2452]|jgi:signal transduction histidine kinase|uniref:histidine kinase n=1 Tax=Drouetiella hepatica Uher 2000/2452 TaxID=904376 RepID=A0A951UPT5_9CYAN|nr:histidine kinase [Drouetiella hepatica Uher 2000/2452]